MELRVPHPENGRNETLVQGGSEDSGRCARVKRVGGQGTAAAWEMEWPRKCRRQDLISRATCPQACCGDHSAIWPCEEEKGR